MEGLGDFCVYVCTIFVQYFIFIFVVVFDCFGLELAQIGLVSAQNGLAQKSLGAPVETGTSKFTTGDLPKTLGVGWVMAKITLDNVHGFTEILDLTIEQERLEKQCYLPTNRCLRSIDDTICARSSKGYGKCAPSWCHVR